MAEPIFVGKGDQIVQLLPSLANRHGLVAGATGTGKTVTLQTLAEGFSRIGTPVFLADVKGDLSGMGAAGGEKPKVEERAAALGLTGRQHAPCPVVFYDVFGEKGHPIRATVSEMGPLLLSRLMDLNPTQSGVLSIAFEIADDQGLLLLDLKDLRAMLAFIGENAKQLTLEYGNVSAASVGAIQRSLLTLEQQGADAFFGEPAFELADLFRTTFDGRGVVSILSADKLYQSPRLYATSLLWLLSELFEELPEIGDPEKPRLVFFFDEAHLLFTDAPKALLEKIEQVVRLIRSKGVGVYFVTQNPLDIPESVLGQLGNRVQHALRAFTPRDQKAVRAAAETFRPNPAFEAEAAITELGVGEALVSLLEAKGTPAVVERVFIAPPLSRLGPLTESERQGIVVGSPVAMKYERAVDRESAYEILRGKAEQALRQAQEAKEADLRAKQEAKAQAAFEKEQARRQRQAPKPAPRRRSDGFGESLAKSVVRSAGSQLGRSLMRGILGSLTRGR